MKNKKIISFRIKDTLNLFDAKVLFLIKKLKFSIIILFCFCIFAIQ